MGNSIEKSGHKAKVDTTNPLEFKKSISDLADDKKVELLAIPQQIRVENSCINY